MDAAIVGLPQSGKTTTFHALTAGHGSSSADARGENIGVVKLPDERLEKLAANAASKKVTPLEFRLHDLPPLFQKGGAGVEATESLSRADVLLHVVRAFERADVPHPNGSVDPERDLRAFSDELILADLGIVERRLEKLDIAVRSARPGERDESEREQKLLLSLKQRLDEGKRLAGCVTDPQELKQLTGFGFLTLKPMLVIANIGESQLEKAAEIEGRIAKAVESEESVGVTALCAKLEAELAELSDEEAAEFRADLGAPEGAVARVLERAGDLLGLVTFFTIGEKEARAWTVKRGSTAVQAAGRIHTDIERGFIRAEVIDWDKLLEAGSHAEARKRGWQRTEGRDYIVQEGDVMNVLFNV